MIARCDLAACCPIGRAAAGSVSDGFIAGRWKPDWKVTSRMVYALFMILVLLTFGAMWRGHALQLPLFLLIVAWVLIHVVRDMTTPLTLNF